MLEIAIVSFVVAPDATQARLDRLSDWASTHRRLVVSALAGVVGIYLLVVGISKF